MPSVADADGRVIAGQAYRIADEPPSDLASGRRGRVLQLVGCCDKARMTRRARIASLACRL